MHGQKKFCVNNLTLKVSGNGLAMNKHLSSDVLVVGGGLHGTSTALHLRRKGVTVRVIEKHFPGRFASGMNAGGVRRLGRHLAEIPLSVAAMEVWHEMGSFIGDDCGFHKVGQVKIAENDGLDIAIRTKQPVCQQHN